MEEAVLGRKNVVWKGFPSWESGGIAQSRCAAGRVAARLHLGRSPLRFQGPQTRDGQ
jgi:hypothetical protein